MGEGAVISAAVEGLVDEAVARRLIVHAGGIPGAVFGKQGKVYLQQKIGAYNNAARRSRWVVLVDLDRSYRCAPLLRASWLARPSAFLCFRVAVRQVEAWLLADGERLAAFLGVSRTRIPENPDALADSKAALVNLARCSRRRAIRDDMVPREGSGRPVGPAYSSRLIEFVTPLWRPEVAAGRSDSLRRAIACLERVARSS